ncbi:MAG: hypothetical protein KF835_15220 [Xanthobacteraceae bacterium]|nr:hypothetical protein [Xanthobacteraceae bacterium]
MPFKKTLPSHPQGRGSLGRNFPVHGFQMVNAFKFQRFALSDSGARRSGRPPKKGILVPFYADFFEISAKR